MKERRFPEYFYNWTTLLGALIAGISFTMVLLLLLLEFFVRESTVYLGLITFVLLPVFISIGLLMVFAGAFFARRRALSGKPTFFQKVFTIDLNNASHQNIVVTVLIVSTIFLLATGVGTYKAYEVTESVEFCGMLCHSVMKPEHTAYQNSSHARVTCAQCHIGPGADYFVKSKITGAYQIYSVLFKKYSKPIPTPIHNLRPAGETCLQCHWPEKFFGARRNVYPHYLSDEKNTPYPVTMLIKIGGGSKRLQQTEGIHWHMAIENKVEYAARDRERMDMAWVRVTKPDGTVEEYQDPASPLSPEDKAKLEVRRMDCMDCHNRPSHNYLSPLRTVNEAMSKGAIPEDLPFVKREAVKALDVEYEDTASALAEIEKKITDFYRENYPDLAQKRAKDIAETVAALREIYQSNFFPEMKVSWRKYPDHLGHFQSAGCFRCHGTALATPAGKTITMDCNVCHTLIQQGGGKGAQTISAQGLTFQHPVDVGGAEMQGNCAACHSGGAELY